jgi:S1-C subfamily serine protease
MNSWLAGWMVDVVILVLLVLAVFSGFRRGAVLQVFSWGGFVVGIVIGAIFAPDIVNFLAGKSSATTRAIVALVAFLSVAFIVEAVIAVAGARIVKRMTGSGVRRADAIAGSVIGAIVVLLSAWLLSAPAERVPELASAFQKSAVLRAERSVLSKPPSILAVIGNLFAHTGFPQVFESINPNLAPGVAAPPASLANDKYILDAAKITYKIEGAGCGGRVDGSGFPVAPHIVITAAHVVAGTTGTHVLPAEGGEYAARVVYMDSRKDIAVLDVPGLPDPSLVVDPNAAPYQTDGAAIGYPGGGKRTISPGRVRARVEAQGYDIYNEHRVSREIYVLRATVHQGNSGGPFVDTRGRVRGMIFAASSSNDQESYALAENEILYAERQAEGRTRQVATGDCAL